MNDEIFILVPPVKGGDLAEKICSMNGGQMCQRGLAIQLTVHKLSDARRVIFSRVQLDSFQEEMKDLEEGKLSRCHPIYRLKPFLRDDGLV